MSDLKQIVTEFLNNNRTIAEELMHEGYFVKNWDDYDGGIPFEFKGVDSYGGEGMGEEYWTVIEVRIPNQDETALVKLNGWYASYEGADYTGWSFVQPKQKTITVYE